MHYNERLKQIREDRDKTQKEIAQILQTTQQHYARYENGNNQITADRLIKLAKYYNLSLDYIAGLIDEPRPLYPPKKDQKKHG